MNINTEALIIGAGPIGLFQAFELALLGIDCCIVEALDKPGGQCTELYAEKPIYDIPGTAYTTASDFIAQLEQQLSPFNIDIHYQQTVERLSATADGFIASTTTGSTFTAQQVLLATGAGAFTPVKLRTDGINDFEATQVHYTEVPASVVKGKSVVVIGDGQAAVDCTINTSEHATNVVFLHRKRRLDASADSLKQLEALTSQNAVQQIKGKITGCTSGSALEQITIQHSSEVTTTHPVDQVLVRQGNSPKQTDFNAWGINTETRLIPVDTAHFESATKNLYAVGDINSYPAKRKLILCGFHEATLAAFAAAARLRPEKPIHTQYTTTSTELLQRLGVSTGNA